MSTARESRPFAVCACAGGPALAHPHSPEPCSHFAEVIVEPNVALCWSCYPTRDEEKQVLDRRRRKYLASPAPGPWHALP